MRQKPSLTGNLAEDTMTSVPTRRDWRAEPRTIKQFDCKNHTFVKITVRCGKNAAVSNLVVVALERPGKRVCGMARVISHVARSLGAIA